jgi:hypothetical protein
VDEAVGIIGQAVLILVGLALLVVLVFFVLLVVRAILRLVRELRPSRATNDATHGFFHWVHSAWIHRSPRTR